ncbi:hypothetical protein GS498_19010 [Rhodococcus hoagii]|nr:hypothetical protein [Prescottella equi]
MSRTRRIARPRAARSGDALALLLQGLSTSDSFGRAELESRVAARFPTLAKKLPRRPELDALVAAVVPGWCWNEERGRYEFRDAPQRLSHVPTRHTLAGSHRPSHRCALRYRAAAARERAGAHPSGLSGCRWGASDQVADALVERFGANPGG